MVESPQVTRLEASADVPLAPRAVWGAILDGSRWPDWMASGDARGGWSGGRPRLTLDHVTPFYRPSGGRDGVTCAVGDIREETAVVSRPFGLGARRVAWHSIVTDIDDGHSIEIASPAVGGLREWRLRVNILPIGVQPLPSWFRLAPPIDRGAGVRHNEREQGESTRVRAILTYRPVGVISRLLDRVSLRSMVQARLEAWMGGLARSLSILSDLESRAVSDPIRYLPDVGRPAATYRPSSRTTGQYSAVRTVVAQADNPATTAVFPTVRGIDADAFADAGQLDDPADLVAGDADLYDDDLADDSEADAAPIPARAVPDVMPAPRVITPVPVEPPAVAATVRVSRDDAGQTVYSTKASPAEVALPVDATSAGGAVAPVPAVTPASPVPAPALVSLLDRSLQALEESAATHLAVPALEPEPAVAAREIGPTAPTPARVDATSPSVTSATPRAPAPRPTLFGEARPSTISASAIAASRRLAAMAANRPVTGLSAVATNPPQSVAVGTGGRAADASTASAPSVASATPAPVPTIGAIAGASRASAAARVEANPGASNDLPAAARAAFVGSPIAPAPSVGLVSETSPTKPPREDASPASSDAAA